MSGNSNGLVLGSTTDKNGKPIRRWMSPQEAAKSQGTGAGWKEGTPATPSPRAAVVSSPPTPAAGLSALAALAVDDVDDFGFDPDGVHSVTGTRLDEKGFNAKGWSESGIHRSTGEPWDERGWRRDGMHKDTMRQTDPDGFFKNGRSINDPAPEKPKVSKTKSADSSEPKKEPVKREARVSITIPFEATEARARAKQLGAKWEPEKKTWRMKPAHAAEVEALIAAHQESKDEAVRARTERERAEEQEKALRRQEWDEFKKTAKSFHIPFEGGEADREFVKSLGGRFDGDRKMWLLQPDAAAMWEERLRERREQELAEREAEKQRRWDAGLRSGTTFADEGLEPGDVVRWADIGGDRDSDDVVVIENVHFSPERWDRVNEMDVPEQYTYEARLASPEEVAAMRERERLDTVLSSAEREAVKPVELRQPAAGSRTVDIGGATAALHGAGSRIVIEPEGTPNRRVIWLDDYGMDGDDWRPRNTGTNTDGREAPWTAELQKAIDERWGA